MTVKKNNLVCFPSTINYPIRTQNIRMSDMFRIMKGQTPLDFVLEVVRSSDLPTYWTKKVDEQISSFIRDKFWTRYFRMEPTSIFLAENLDQALELSEIFQRSTQSSRFRVTTDKDLIGGIDKATFYKYDEAGKRMVPVVASIFQANS